MIRHTTRVKLPDGFKKQAIKLIDDTIDSVLYKKNATLTNREKIKIKNLSMDQVNVNVSNRNKSKTIWVFDTEDCIPVPVKVDSKLGNFDKFLHENPEANYYAPETNLTWTFKKSNSDNGVGITKKEFEEKVLKTLLEDFETAAFYGALSFIDG